MLGVYLRRWRKSLAEAVTEYPLKSQSFECRPLHGSLPLVVLLPASWRVGLVLCPGVATGPGEVVELVVDACRECVGMAVGGDLGRLSGGAPRERLRERPRIRAAMAPKKDSSVGDAAMRDVGDVGEYGGEIWPDDDDCDFCESTVFVRMGRGMF